MFRGRWEAAVQSSQTETPVTIQDPLVTGLRTREDSPPRAAVPPLQKHGVPLAAPGEAGLSCSKILAGHFQEDAKATASIKMDEAPPLQHQTQKRKSPRLLSYRVNLHLTRAQWLPQGTETSTRWPSGQLQDSSKAANGAGCGMQGAEVEGTQEELDKDREDPQCSRKKTSFPGPPGTAGTPATRQKQITDFGMGECHLSLQDMPGIAVHHTATSQDQHSPDASPIRRFTCTISTS